MKLIVKLNLAIILPFLLVAVVAGMLHFKLLEKNAYFQVVDQAELILDQMDALRTYTVREVRPLSKLNNQGYEEEFHPQVVPAYAATQVANHFADKRPEYSYKEAVLNPTNLRDKAAPWEAKVINQHIAEPSKEKLIGNRWVRGTKSLYIAKPIKILDSACLECHSTPARAPVSMVDKYGRENGFGWKLGETVGTQMVIVPYTLTTQLAGNTFKSFLMVLIGLFFVCVLGLNIAYWVIRHQVIRARSNELQKR